MPLGKRAGILLGDRIRHTFTSTPYLLLSNMISPHFSEERFYYGNTDFHKHAFPNTM